MYPTPKLSRLLLSSIIATAFAAPAMAQTNITIEGIADLYVGSMKNSGDAGRTATLGSGGMSTSFLGFKGNEDLGAGLKAHFTLGAFLRADDGASGRFTGDTYFGRDANVGLSGSFGSIALGRSISPTTLPVFLFNPMGDSFTLSPLVLHMAVPTGSWTPSFAGDTGWSNQIRYTTPSFGGLTANLSYQLGEAAGNTGKNNFGGNVLYFNGPLSLTAAYHRVEVNNPFDALPGPSVVNAIPGTGISATRQKFWLVGGGYDLKVVKLFATYDESKHNVSLEDKTASLGLSAPVGAGNILAGYARTKRSSVAFAERTRDTFSIGYDYNLSKRTDLYTFVMGDKVTGFDREISYAAGIRHRF
ncbi:MAG: porin [Herminiimonas sp.]|nr:porin [Herminiimonas sp.]